MPDLKSRRRPALDVELQLPQLVDQAADLTRYILAGNPERLRHSEAVAARAQLLTAAVEDDQAPFLVASAWLHDIGYAVGLRDTGFHPLDGARHLRAAGWPQPLCDLVAHHSGSRFVATRRRLDEEIGEFTFQQDMLSDALTVADQTAGPYGRPMTVDERIRDMLDRHGPDSPNVRAHARREPYLRGAARRVAFRLEAVGITATEHRIF
jgi:hypothetical protein